MRAFLLLVLALASLAADPAAAQTLAPLVPGWDAPPAAAPPPGLQLCRTGAPPTRPPGYGSAARSNRPAARGRRSRAARRRPRHQPAAHRVGGEQALPP